MLIIRVRDNEQMKEKCKKTNKQTNKQKPKRTKHNRSSSKRVRVKLFCCTFWLGFLQLIRKAPLIFKQNFELALSIILKQGEL